MNQQRVFNPILFNKLATSFAFYVIKATWPIILVEQFFDFAYELGDEFTVMKRGAVSFNRRADGLDRQTLYDAVTV
jgi:urea transport system ATP-binding protein